MQTKMLSRTSSIETKIMEKSAPQRRPLVFRWTVMLLKALLSQWQTLGIGIAVISAYLFPNFGRRGGVIESQYGPNIETS